MAERLPIHALKEALEARLGTAPLVITAPTGTGKSTEVPRWCGRRGRTLVVEPRRVACRSLAARVAELEGVELGREVGYVVRAERRAGDHTRILFATPGIVLRMLGAGPSRPGPAPEAPQAPTEFPKPLEPLDAPPDGLGDLEPFDTIVLDEFHERSLEVDLLLALLAHRAPERLVVMSATLEGERVASRLGGEHLHAEGRTHPVEIDYRPDGTLLPDVRGLERRVTAAVEAAREDPGTVLVFLPGKGEIAACARAMSAGPEEVLPLHGGLTLAEQSRVFTKAARRRVVLATNVAETSLTLPDVGVVVDAGLVRQTRYRDGRGYLTLVPVATDSAEQRAGRAGRTRPGTCVRLWDPAAQLEAATPPEVHRESLVPLVLSAAACGAAVEDLPFLDPPKPHAVAAARAELGALGALTPDGRLTERGRRLFGLPLDPWIGTFLVEAARRDRLETVVDLAAALSVDRSPFGRPLDPEDEDDPRQAGCDATALVLAVRRGRAGRHGMRGEVLAEMRSVRDRLREVFDLGPPPRDPPKVDREALAAVLLAADPRVAHVARRRRGRTAWSNGGTELELGRESAADAEAHEVVAVLGSRALGVGRRGRKLVITAAMPLRPSWLVRAGLGRERLAGVSLEHGRVVASVERVYAGRVLETRERTPEGSLLREAVRDLCLRGRLFRGVAETARERLEAWALARRLAEGGQLEPLEPLDDGPSGQGPVETWLLERLDGLGLEQADDLELLAPEDLLPPDLPVTVRQTLDFRYPRRIESGDATYRLHYDPAAREVRVEKVAGTRRTPPPPAWLPGVPGFRFVYVDGNRVIPLSGR